MPIHRAISGSAASLTEEKSTRWISGSLLTIARQSFVPDRRCVCAEVRDTVDYRPREPPGKDLSYSRNAYRASARLSHFRAPAHLHWPPGRLNERRHV